MNNRKSSIKPSNDLLLEVNKLLKNKNTRNNGIKKLTNRLRYNHPDWNINNINMGKVREARRILKNRNNKNRSRNRYSINRSSRNRSNKRNKTRTYNRSVRSMRNIPSLGFLSRIGRSLKGPHAKTALELAVHPTKGLAKYGRVPEKPPTRIWNINTPSSVNIATQHYL